MDKGYYHEPHQVNPGSKMALLSPLMEFLFPGNICFKKQTKKQFHCIKSYHTLPIGILFSKEMLKGPLFSINGSIYEAFCFQPTTKINTISELYLLLLYLLDASWSNQVVLIWNNNKNNHFFVRGSTMGE